MKCPNCKEKDLVLSERQGIEIDYCPECRGVWLDRGELDKIIEKSAREETARIDQRSSSDNYRKEHSGKYEREHYYKKRKSFLSELFD